MKRANFQNARQLKAIDHSQYYAVPTDGEIIRILGEPIACMRLNADGERLWIRVTSYDIADRSIRGTVTTDLLSSHLHGLVEGSEVHVSFDYVFGALAM